MSDAIVRIKRSPTADTRTCDWSKVSKDTLLASSKQHIADVQEGMVLLCMMIGEAAHRHDFDKITDIDGFHRDFKTGFKQTAWWDNHRKVNRHHLSMDDGVPEDVNLIDVLDHIVDCVMAGMARSGSVYDLSLPASVLERAFANTVELFKSHVRLEENE